MQSPAWYLSHSPRTRYTTGALAYFAQGIPMGLLHIALPAWLATKGVSAVQIATFLSVIMLPWAFKLLTGPLMDHFEFLPMGKRRPWGAGLLRFGMVISLMSLAHCSTTPWHRWGLPHSNRLHDQYIYGHPGCRCRWHVHRHGAAGRRRPSQCLHEFRQGHWLGP